MLARAAIATAILATLAASALSAEPSSYDAPATPHQSTPAPAPVPAPAAPAAPVGESSGEPGPKWRAQLNQLRAQVDELKAQLAAERRDNRRQLNLLRRSSASREKSLLRVLSREPQVIHALELGAAAYGVPPARLQRIAWCESNHIPTAQNGRYLGLFQFGTWLWEQSPFGRFERTDPYAAALAASWAFSRGYDRHWPICGKL